MDLTLSDSLKLDADSNTQPKQVSMVYHLPSVKSSIQQFILKCDLLGLRRTVTWLSELNYALTDVQVNASSTSDSVIKCDNFEYYLMAYATFNLKEYGRSANLLQVADSDEVKFLRHYSLYKAYEQEEASLEVNDNTCPKLDIDSSLVNLDETLRLQLTKKPDDGFTYYLRGLVQLKMENTQEAIELFSKAVSMEQLLWEAWEELSKVVKDKTMLCKLKLPYHWMKEFFLVEVYLKIHKNDEANIVLTELCEHGFKESLFVLSRIALVHNNRREICEGINVFKRICQTDPFRIEEMDVYSNLLFLSESRVDLAHLASRMFEINKYTPQTCCILGNYSGLRQEHAKAAQYFRRAVKLDKNFIFALTLCGQEYIEMRDAKNATQLYRRVIAAKPTDHTAWYNLGQMYEILKMPSYSLNYYKRAHLLRPNDSRILSALGEVYELLEKYDEAIKCYNRARNVGDEDSFAVQHLAKLYEKLGEKEEAVRCYREWIDEANDKLLPELSEAYKFLSYHYITLSKFALAFRFAQLCLNFEQTKEEGKSLLKEIASRRICNFQDSGGENEEDDAEFIYQAVLNKSFSTLNI